MTSVPLKKNSKTIVKSFMRYFILMMFMIGPVSQAQAQMPPAVPIVMQEKPLLVIRFNQRTVYYSKALYMAVSKAVEAKPEVMFSLTSIIPQTGDAERDRILLNASKVHTRQVMRDLQGMGVPPSRVTHTLERSSAVDFDEVHLRAY